VEESFVKKNSKWIMTGLSCVLMLAWLLGRDHSGPNPSAVVKGTLDGRKVTMVDLYSCASDKEILEGFLGHAQNPDNNIREITTFLFGNDYLKFKGALDTSQRDLHLFLLLKEAQKYGISVNTADVDQAIREAGVTDADLESYLTTNHMNLNMVRHAVSDILTVHRLSQFAGATLAVSVPELQHLAVDTTASMKVRYVLLDTSDAGKMDWTPTDDALKTQFDLYKSIIAFDPDTATTATDPKDQQPPLVDGHHYPFGYKYPDRVKLDVLTFDRKQVRDSIKPSTDDYLEARQEYKDHPEKYQGKVPETLPSTKAGPTTTPAATEEATTTTRPFEDVRADILKDIIERRTDQRMKEMTDAATAALKTTWDRFKDENGFYSTPPEQWPSYETVANDIEKQFGVRPKLEAFGKTWLTRKSITTTLKDGIGGAAMFTQGRPMIRFVDLAMNVHQLQPNQQGLVASLHVQVGVDGPVVQDQQGNQYIYRVAAASLSHEPASMNEEHVRGDVISDLRRVAMQQHNLKLAQQINAEAGKIGLDKAAQKQSLKLAITGEFTRLTPAEFNPYTGKFDEPKPRPIEPLGIVPEFTDAAFNLMTAAATGSPASAEPTTTPAATTQSSPTTASAMTAAATKILAGLRKTTYFPIDSRVEVAVIELIDSQPATHAGFDENRANLRDSARGSQIIPFVRKWYTLTETANRMKFSPTEPFKATDATKE
jgi:hypothetical protein